MSLFCGCDGTCCIYCSEYFPQPVITSGPAICAAECSTVGTQCTINALVSSGFSTLQAAFCKQTPTPANTAVRAQPQAGAATSSKTIFTWLAIAGVAILVFMALGKRL